MMAFDRPGGEAWAMGRMKGVRTTLAASRVRNETAPFTQTGSFQRSLHETHDGLKPFYPDRLGTNAKRI